MTLAAMTEVPPKTTPLHEEHVRCGARMIPFSGWLMPVQYTGIVDEHHTVRKAVGVFDISHMGQLIVTGAGATDWLNRMLTNNVARLELGNGQYTFLLNENGGIIDDLIVYRTGENEFLLVVNASRAEEDFVWLKKHLAAGIALRNRSDEFAALAIQGPRALDLFQAVFGEGCEPPARNQIVDLEFDNIPVTVARTGYTGEDGFEWFFTGRDASRVWAAVLKKGEPLGVKPCGLGARDTLRLEMCYPLNGNDLTPEHNPIEAGLGFFVDVTKDEFVGRKRVAADKENGPARKLVPFRMTGKGPPPRPHYMVFHGEERVGEVTSGTLSPSLQQGIGMAYVPAALAKTGTELQIDIRSQKFPAVIEKKPFYKKQPS